MVYFLQIAFILLHIATAAAWFGAGMRLTGQTKLISKMEGPGATLVAEDIQHALRVMGILLILTLVFGMGALIAGGIKGPQYHTAALLIVILIALHYFMLQPAGKGLVSATGTSSDMDGLRKRLAMGLGIGHLVWIVILVLMFWHRISTGN